MRIAVVTSSYPRFLGDTVAPFIQSLCEGLIDHGHEIAVLAPDDIEVVPSHHKNIQMHRFKYIWPRRLHLLGHARALRRDVNLNFSAYILLPLYLISGILHLRRLVRDRDTDFIQAHWLIPSGFVAAIVSKLTNIPFCVSLHGSDMYIARRTRLFRMVSRWIFRQATVVTACSHELYHQAEQLDARGKVVLIPWGADPDLFHPKNSAYTYHPKFPWRKHGFLVGSLGRMVDKKGFNVLVQSMKTVISKHPSAQLVIGGEGPNRKDLQRTADELRIRKNIHLPGKINWDEVPEYLTSLDLFVLPSVMDSHGNVDGLPTVLLEAMSSGTPTIASDIGGVRLVIEDSKTGVLVPPGDPLLLAQKIIFLIDHPDETAMLARNARLSVETRFTWGIISGKFSELFESIVHGSFSATAQT